MRKHEVRWCCAYRKRGSERFITIKNPWWGWCADPFLFEYKNEIFIFAEVWNDFLMKGSIGYTKLVDGKFTKWRIIIREKYHLSYPFIWNDKMGIHICPESGRAKKTSRYDSISFPDKWVKTFDYNKGLRLVDTTFLICEGKIEKAFSYSIEKESEQLVDLDLAWNGEYKILSDDKHNSRMAGGIISENGKLYRLAQIGDCSYGEGICINEIECIEPYHETRVKEYYFDSIESDFNKKVIGMHTYNRIGDYEVIDLRYKSFRLYVFILGQISDMINIIGGRMVSLLRKMRSKL